MAADDTCKGCGRSRRSALMEPVERCDDRFNQGPGRCLWHTAQCAGATAVGDPVFRGEKLVDTTAQTEAAKASPALVPAAQEPPRLEAAGTAELRGRLQAAEAEAAELQGRLDAAQALERRAAALASRLATLEAEAASLRAQADADRAASADALAETERQRAAAAEASASRERLEREVQALRASVATITEQHDAAPTHEQLQSAHGAREALQREVDELRQKLRDSIGTLPATPTGRWIAGLVASRMKLGGLSGVLGLVLGAGGIGWWQHDTPETGSPTSTVVASASPTVAGRTTRAPSTPPGPGASSASIDAGALRDRLAAALAGQNLPATVEVAPGLDSVTIDTRSLSPVQRSSTNAVLRAALAGAGLPNVSIENVIVDDRRDASTGALPSGARPPPTRREPAVSAIPTFPSASTRVGNGAPARAPSAANLRLGKAGGPPASSEGTTADAAAVRSATSPSEALGKQAACRRRIETGKLDPRFAFRMSVCMRNSCCNGKTLSTDAECRDFDLRFPLNCEAPY